MLPELSHDQNNFDINFIGISFIDERAIRYRYRLLGADEEWRPPTAQNSVTYAALQPGNYTFQVNAFNVNGVQSYVPASTSFTILSPYWRRWWFIASLSLLISFCILLIVRLRERRLLEIERIRTRIATDLHDDIGASLTRISLSSAVAQQEINRIIGENVSASKLKSFLDDIGNNSRELIDSMSDVVWSVDPKKDSFDNLTLRMKTLLSKVAELKGIDYDVEIDASLTELRLPLDFKRNVYLIFKEALNNAIRHANASHILLSLKRENNFLTMVLKDNGNGFSGSQTMGGNGLRNMKQRAEVLGGTLEVSSAMGEGTILKAELKLP